MRDNIKYQFLKKLKNKYRLVILNDGTFEERITVKITPLLILSITMLVSFLLIISTFLLFSFTPLKEYVPGKTTTETKKELIKISIKVDSLVILLEGRDLYVNNLRTILNGGVPTNKISITTSENKNKNSDLNISEKDSVFRLMVERKTNGDYISVKPNGSIYFYSPLSGDFTEKYDRLKNHFGVDIISNKGIVVLSNWTKETGYVIAVQHTEGFLSLYKHNSSLLKEVGDLVKTGEPIAIIGNSGELSTGPHLHFELWKNGKSVDPENYISF
jgi:murein DD-endopeptidase MepM/ murein hydrolase activator NlpD